jgi:alpha-L-fucosidase
VDIVSRNGNLMLNIPLPASGMPDADELAVLDEISKWMAVNSEGIYGSRPWKIFGEGVVEARPGGEGGGQSFNESKRKLLTDTDVRFVTKGGVLFAYFMGWPVGGSVKIRALAGANVEGVELLGYGKVEFRQGSEGLEVMLPGQKPCEYAYGLKLMGRGLV